MGCDKNPETVENRENLNKPGKQFHEMDEEEKEKAKKLMEKQDKN